MCDVIRERPDGEDENDEDEDELDPRVEVFRKEFEISWKRNYIYSFLLTKAPKLRNVLSELYCSYIY